MRPDARCSTSRPTILDDADTPVPVGTVGEIAHRSPHLMLGYLDDPAKTAEAFRGGWFHSGDLGYYDEHGLLHVVDRKKDMIKTGGENVASREVEEVLYRHDGVQEVAVFGVPHPVWVEAVVAAVVPRDGVDADRGRHRRPLPGTPGRVQNPQTGVLRRRAAEEPQRQAAQTHAAGTLQPRTAFTSPPAKGIRSSCTKDASRGSTHRASHLRSRRSACPRWRPVEILIRVTRANICGSDVHAWHGTFATRDPKSLQLPAPDEPLEYRRLRADPGLDDHPARGRQRDHRHGVHRRIRSRRRQRKPRRHGACASS